MQRILIINIHLCTCWPHVFGCSTSQCKYQVLPPKLVPRLLMTSKLNWYQRLFDGLGSLEIAHYCKWHKAHIMGKYLPSTSKKPSTVIKFNVKKLQNCSATSWKITTIPFSVLSSVFFLFFKMTVLLKYTPSGHLGKDFLMRCLFLRPVFYLCFLCSGKKIFHDKSKNYYAWKYRKSIKTAFFF